MLMEQSTLSQAAGLPRNKAYNISCLCTTLLSLSSYTVAKFILSFKVHSTNLYCGCWTSCAARAEVHDEDGEGDWPCWCSA